MLEKSLNFSLPNCEILHLFTILKQALVVDKLYACHQCLETVFDFVTVLVSTVLFSVAFQSNRVSTTPGNPGNLLEFKNPPGNPGNLEFYWSSWKFFKMIDHIGFRSYTGYQIAYLSTNWSPYFSFAMANGVLNVYHVFLLYLAKLHYDSRFGTGRNNANVSWILLEIPPGNLLEFRLVKFVDTLIKYTLSYSRQS